MGYDVFKFGALYLNDKVQPVPQEPMYGGDIPTYDKNEDISIKEANHKITWIKPNGLSLLIADRALLTSVSWESLRRNGFDKGKTILIDGQRFLCRMPQVGLRAGAPNEWDQALDIAGEDNSLWHWHKAYFWGNDMSSGNKGASRKICQARGFVSARKWAQGESTIPYFTYGFRPVLEPLGTVSPFSSWVLDGECFQLDYIPGGDGFCPILQPVRESVFADIPDDGHVRMYTFMEGGHPIPIGGPVRYNSHLTLTDRYFGDEYLIPWTISNGIAVASQSFPKQL